MVGKRRRSLVAGIVDHIVTFRRGEGPVPFQPPLLPPIAPTPVSQDITGRGPQTISSRHRRGRWMGPADGPCATGGGAVEESSLGVARSERATLDCQSRAGLPLAGEPCTEAVVVLQAVGGRDGPLVCDPHDRGERRQS